MSKTKQHPRRALVSVKAGDEIMFGGKWYTVTGVENDMVLWRNGERDGKLPLHMVTQSMVRPGDPLPEVADDADCQAVAATLGSLGKYFAKIVPDDDRERAAVILRIRGKDDQKIILPPSLKVVAAGQGWRAVRHTTPDDVAAAQAAYDANLAAQSPKFDYDHVVATDDPDQKVGIFKRAGDHDGTIRYPNGRTNIKPLALIRLAAAPLTSGDNPSDETDFVSGDWVYNIHDKTREIGVFFADRDPGFACIQYACNRQSVAVPLDDIRAAIRPADDDSAEPEALPAGEPQPVPEFIADASDLTTEEIDAVIDEVAADLSDDEEVSEQVMDTPLLGEDDNDSQDLDYRKGDKMHAANGKDYTVMSVEGEWVRLKHATGEINIKAAEIPGLLHAKAQPNWEDEVVRLSAQLIEAQEKIRALEDEIAQAAAQAAGAVEMIPMEQREIESFTLPPIDLFNVNLRQERDRLLATLRNSGWFVVYESAVPFAPADEITRMYHTARLERPLDERAPGERSAIDQATAHVDAIIGLDDTEAIETPEAGADLQPASIRSGGTYPISDAIRAHGVGAVKTFFNTQTCEVFDLTRATTRAALTPGGES